MRERTLPAGQSRHALVALALLLVAAGSCGCATANIAGSRASTAPSAMPSRSATDAAAARAASFDDARQARALIGTFYRPDAPTDPGYELLGTDHNDYAAWTRSVVLARTDYPSLVRSIGAQQTGLVPGALATFDRTARSKGATATYDAVIGSEWRLQDDRPTSADRRLAGLIPASTVMGLLFDSGGRLLETYGLVRFASAGATATLVYAAPGHGEVSLVFRTAKGPDGIRRISGWTNYRQVRDALRGNEVIDGLP